MRGNLWYVCWLQTDKEGGKPLAANVYTDQIRRAELFGMPPHTREAILRAAVPDG